MEHNQNERKRYKKILEENVSRAILKRWPFNYHCGLWDKHKPDAEGRKYVIYINRTRGINCGKSTLIHELIHIRDDLDGTPQSNSATEDEAIRFYEKNKKFIDFLWQKYVC